MQETGSITQSVANWWAGTYQLSFYAAQRGDNNAASQNFQVLIDGAVVGSFTPGSSTYQAFTTNPFTVTAGSHTIQFLGIDSAGGDSTVLIDRVRASFAPSVGDMGFESVSVAGASGKYQYAPSGSAWTFSGASPSGSGLTGNSGAFTSSNPNAPEGSQAAFLQKTGTITQSVANWVAGAYQLSFYAAQRGSNNAASQNFQVLIDGASVGSFTPAGSTYQAFTTSPFTVTAGNHTIQFVGLDSAGGDNTALIDRVQVNAVLNDAPPPAEFNVVPLTASRSLLQWDPIAGATGYRWPGGRTRQHISRESNQRGGTRGC